LIPEAIQFSTLLKRGYQEEKGSGRATGNYQGECLTLDCNPNGMYFSGPRNGWWVSGIAFLLPNPKTAIGVVTGKQVRLTITL